MPENIQKKLSLPDALKGLQRNEDKFNATAQKNKSQFMPEKQASKKISKTAAEKQKSLRKMESKGFAESKMTEAFKSSSQPTGTDTYKKKEHQNKITIQGQTNLDRIIPEVPTRIVGAANQ